MPAMILAAGQGKRLRPITNNIPKPMVQVANHTLLSWHITKLKEQGITDLVVNGAYLKDTLFDYLKDGSQFGVNIKHSLEDGDGLETAGGIIKALPLLGDQPFFVVNGDVFYAGKYDEFLIYPQSLNTGKTIAHLFLVPNPPHNLKGDFTISPENILEYGADYTFSGFAWYHPKAFAQRQVQREPLRPYFDAWVKDKLVTATLLSKPWFDIGTVERLNALNTFVKEHASSITPWPEQP